MSPEFAQNSPRIRPEFAQNSQNSLKAALKGEVIETYTEDIRGKGYLVLGEGPLHVHVGYNKYRQKAIIITTYVPEAPKWITSRKRG